MRYEWLFEPVNGDPWATYIQPSRLKDIVKPKDQRRIYAPLIAMIFSLIFKAIYWAFIGLLNGFSFIGELIATGLRKLAYEK
jgi:hypothetical protein